MTEARSKLLVRIILAVVALATGVVVLYATLALRATGYGEVRLQGEAISEARKNLDARMAEARADFRQRQQTEQTRQWGYLAAYAELVKYMHPSVSTNVLGEYPISPERVAENIAGSAGRVISSSFFETFPERWRAQHLEEFRRQRNDALTRDDETPFVVPTSEPTSRMLLDWFRARYLHAALIGDEAEATRALVQWVEILRDMYWMKNVELQIGSSVHGMLEAISALENDAPEATFSLMRNLLEDRLHDTRPSEVGRRIDKAYQRESAKASFSQLGTGTLSYLFDGLIPKARKNTLLPLIRVEMQAMAVAAFHNDLDAFVAAQDRYELLKSSFPAPWHSDDFYAWRTSLPTQQRREMLEAALLEWKEFATFREMMEFQLFVLSVLQFRYENLRWPEESELDRSNIEEPLPQMHWLERGTMEITRWQEDPNYAQIMELDGRYLGSFVQTPVHYEGAPRPIFYRRMKEQPKPSMFQSFLLFIPQLFSEEFRRFMRGEDGELSTEQPPEAMPAPAHER